MTLVESLGECSTLAAMVERGKHCDQLKADKHMDCAWQKHRCRIRREVALVANFKLAAPQRGVNAFFGRRWSAGTLRATALLSAAVLTCLPAGTAFSTGSAYRTDKLPFARSTGRCGVAPCRDGKQILEGRKWRTLRENTSPLVQLKMMLEPSTVAALSDGAMYLSVGGGLAGTASVVMIDQNTFNLAIGAFSGMVATAVVFPIDTAKTRIQAASNDDSTETRSTLETLRHVVETDGVPALYRGLIPVMIGSAPESAVQLTVFELVKKFLRGTQAASADSIWVSMVAGMIAGTAQVVVTNPLEVIKISAQTNSGPPKSSLQLIKELGPGGLFNGWRATLFRDIPFAGIYFPVYCQAKSLVSPLLPSPLAGAMVAGLAAGMFAAGITTPADVIKTNIQAFKPTPVIAGSDAATAPASAAECQGLSPGAEDHDSMSQPQTSTAPPPQPTQPLPPAPPGIASTARRIYDKKGWGGLLSGIDARVTRQAPAQGVCLFVFELLKQIFRTEPIRLGPVFVAVSDDVTGVKYYADYRAAAGSIRTKMDRIAGNFPGTSPGDEVVGGAAKGVIAIPGQTSGFMTGASSGGGGGGFLETAAIVTPDPGLSAAAESVGRAVEGGLVSRGSGGLLSSSRMPLDRLFRWVEGGVAGGGVGGEGVGGSVVGSGVELAMDKIDSLRQTIDLNLWVQTPTTAAAALSQELTESVVVPVWQCGGLVGEAFGTCINQGIAQF